MLQCEERRVACWSAQRGPSVAPRGQWRSSCRSVGDAAVRSAASISRVSVWRPWWAVGGVCVLWEWWVVVIIARCGRLGACIQRLRDGSGGWLRGTIGRHAYPGAAAIVEGILGEMTPSRERAETGAGTQSGWERVGTLRRRAKRQRRGSVKSRRSAQITGSQARKAQVTVWRARWPTQGVPTLVETASTRMGRILLSWGFTQPSIATRPCAITCSALFTARHSFQTCMQVDRRSIRRRPHPHPPGGALTGP